MNVPGTNDPYSTRVRWLLIFWLFVLSCVAFLDRVNMSIAGSSIATSYHLTNVQLGSVFSAFLWGYALFQTIAGALVVRLGPRRVLAVGVVWWGIFTALTAAVPVSLAGALRINSWPDGFPQTSAASLTAGFSQAWAWAPESRRR
jgi:ACS family glucarate transporter-like MFS transporter